MTTIGTRLFTALRGSHVGDDEFGNRYYRARRLAPGRRERRWVIYSGASEASSVPPAWHGWLHHSFKAPPTESPLAAPSWEKPHQRNLTGTPAAYRPPGHILKGVQREHATGDYEAWRPE